MLEKIIFEFFKLMLLPIIFSLLYYNQGRWTKFISAVTCGGLLYNVIPTNYIFSFKDWLCSYDLVNTIYSIIRPIVWKGDAKMLALITNFIVITFMFCLVFYLSCKFNPDFLKRINLQKDIQNMKVECKTKKQYEVRKKRLLKDYNSLKNTKHIQILFEENWEDDEIIIKYFFKKEELLKVSFFVTNEEKNEQKKQEERLYLEEQKNKDIYNQLTIKLDEMTETFLKEDISNIKEQTRLYLIYELHIIPYILQNKVIIEVKNLETQEIKIITINK